MSPLDTLCGLVGLAECFLGLAWGFLLCVALGVLPALERLPILDLAGLCDDRLATGEDDGVAFFGVLLSPLEALFGLPRAFSPRVALGDLPAAERLAILDFVGLCDGCLFALVTGDVLVGEGLALPSRLEEPGVALF